MTIIESHYAGAAMLALADGRVFRGMAFGARRTCVGEVVFNTSMYGYQEILTDPSYRGQLVCFTSVEIGNVGTNADDEESQQFGAEGVIVRSLAPKVSNWRSTASLHDLMVRRQMPGIAEIDTRALTRHLRVHGSMMAALSTETLDPERLLALARAAQPMEGRALAREVSTRTPHDWDTPTWSHAASVPACDLHVVVLDFGVKLNILRNLRDVGARSTVMPADATVDEILAQRPDGVVLSNGPGDPAALDDIIVRIRELLTRAPTLPVFGICLGHQLLCLALGGKTYKLAFGHHGGNHPVRSERDARVEITAQNHGFAVEIESLGRGAQLAHLNLFDGTVAGLRLRDRPVWSVQFHPEAAPGPSDAQHLFMQFAQMVRQAKHETGTVQQAT